MRTAWWLAILAATVIAGTFAVSNRLVVSLALWPLPYVVALPVYLLVLAALLAGFLAGAAAAWVGGRHRRRALRRCRKRVEALESELTAARSRLPDRAAASPPATG